MSIPVSTFFRKQCVKEYKQFTKATQIGKGHESLVYVLCTENKYCPYVLKVDYTNEPHRFFTTINVQKQVAEIGIAPTVYDIWFCKQNNRMLGFAVMDRMDGSLLDLDVSKLAVPLRKILARELGKWVQYLHAFGVSHNDIWEANVLFKKRPGGAIQLYLADFGNITFTDDFRDDNDMTRALQHRIIAGALRGPPLWMENDPRSETDILQGVKRHPS